MIVLLIGGIGLFLLGMVLMTEGLKALAGDALREILSRFVAGPITAMTSGAVSTVLVQSSSATTLTTIGFVSAGLITFPQAIAVIMGANLGTTSIGWIVAVLGFQMDITMVTLPLIAAGALMRLLLSRPWSQLGLMLAGFGLIFVGIGTMQEAMEGVADRIDLSRFAEPTLLSKLVLLVIGAVMTVLLQASGAALAMTLAALHTGAIDLSQAAALVIGQNVGTTVKVVIVAIGARTAVKRTAAAHILFNVVTAAVAFVLLTPFVGVVAWSVQAVEPEPGVLTLAAFHTAFNVLGVILFLPFLDRFAGFIGRMVPESGSALTRHLDPAVTSVPGVAVEAARRCVMLIGAVVVSAVRDRLQRRRGEAAIQANLDEAEQALSEVRQFLSKLNTHTSDGGETSRSYHIHLATLHAVDHVARLIAVLREARNARRAVSEPEFENLTGPLLECSRSLHRWLLDDTQPEVAAEAELLSRSIAQERRDRRPQTLRRTASGALSPDAALGRIDALHWIDRVGYHCWRIAHHLSEAGSTDGTPAEAAESPASEATSV